MLLQKGANFSDSGPISTCATDTRTQPPPQKEGEWYPARVSRVVIDA